MLSLDKLIPLIPELTATGISEEDYDRDRARPPTTTIGETRYVEAVRWKSFMRTIFARACFDGAGLTPHEHPRWCRPGVLPLADLLEDAPTATTAEPEPATAT